MSIYDGLKDAAKVLQEAGKIEEYKEILNILEKLLEMQKRIMDLESENRDLKGKLEVGESLVFERNAYWTSGDQKSGPYCSRCWDSDKKLIRMQPYGNPAYFGCPNCENRSVKVGHDPY